MRIQKFIADCGVCSRRAAEEKVIEGKVTVNGKPAEIGMDIDPDQDKVVCEGKRIHLKNCDKQYFMFYKPRGVITSMKAQDDRSVIADLIKKINGRVYPVGRLDRDSEGILILTDDGELSLRLTHPRYHIAKTYRVTVKGRVSDEQLEKLRNGVELDDGMTLPAEVLIHSEKTESGDEDEYGEIETRVLKTALHITISEGRNRQIRRMCEAVGLEVMLLKRIAVGEISIGHLRPGEYRPLSEKEKAKLLQSVGMEYTPRASNKDRPVTQRRYGREKSVYERRFIKEFVAPKKKRK